MAWQKTTIKIKKDYSPAERIAIAEDIIEQIVKRTQKMNLDKNGQPFPKYSKNYKESLDFKIAGKSGGNVNLTLSGDMLTELDLISHRAGELLIGFENGSEENAKAEGNIKGTYGQKHKIRGKKRDFLGITKTEKDNILKKYPLKDIEARKKTVDIAEKARKIAEKATTPTMSSTVFDRVFRGDSDLKNAKN